MTKKAILVLALAIAIIGPMTGVVEAAEQNEENQKEMAARRNLRDPMRSPNRELRRTPIRTTQKSYRFFGLGKTFSKNH